MANIAIIEATRYADGRERNCVYLGSYQEDGWVYFNDDIWWRAKKDKSNTQLFYISKEIWVSTTSIQITNIKLLNATQMQDIINGGGSVAPGGQGVEDALAWAKTMAEDESHGYDQQYRWGQYGDYDCSSFVYEAFRIGGGFNLPTHSGYTGTMITDFTNAGFTWYPGIGNSSTDCLRGDILLNITDHVEIYMGGQMLIGAHINEFGGITGGQPGDQTGNEISYGGFYSYPWDGILRYEG